MENVVLLSTTSEKSKIHGFWKKNKGSSFFSRGDKNTAAKGGDPPIHFQGYNYYKWQTPCGIGGVKQDTTALDRVLSESAHRGMQAYACGPALCWRPALAKAVGPARKDALETILKYFTVLNIV